MYIEDRRICHDFLFNESCRALGKWLLLAPPPSPPPPPQLPPHCHHCRSVHSCYSCLLLLAFLLLLRYKSIHILLFSLKCWFVRCKQPVPLYTIRLYIAWCHLPTQIVQAISRITFHLALTYIYITHSLLKYRIPH